MWINFIFWLVVFNHLEKYESQWEGLSHILWKIKYVWNHRPIFQVELYFAFHIHIYVYMWANYNNSLTWNKTKLGYIIPLTNHYSMLRSQWGHYNLPRYAYIYIYTWWLMPLSKWVITPVINGISRVNPLITGVITHLLSGMSHQVLLPLAVPSFKCCFTKYTIPGVTYSTSTWQALSKRPSKRPVFSFSGELKPKI